MHKNVQRTFPYKLWNLINSPEDNGVKWSPDGNEVHIHKKLFIQKCLGNLQKFKTSKFLSITKQLNVYGFVQLPHNKSNTYPTYYSPNFKRDCPKLLSKFTRRIATSIEKPARRRRGKKNNFGSCRKVLGSISNLQEKTRTLPIRKARLVEKPFLKHYLEESSSSPSKLSTILGTPIVSLKSPIIIQKRKVDPVTEARAHFHRVLHENVQRVINLPTGLTSSTGSDSSIVTDISNRPVKFPPPPRTNPYRVMWNGNCPPTPPLITINPVAFMSSPWNGLLEHSIFTQEMYVVNCFNLSSMI